MALMSLVRSCSRLTTSKKGLFCGILQPGWIEGRAGAKRNLLREDVLKLQEFQERRLGVAHSITTTHGKYIQQFNEKLQKYELILQDELKFLLYLCQSKDDMVIARDAISRYHSENRNMSYEEFRFGPLFMRLCYHLGLEEMAVDAIKDENIKGFFNDSTSFNIAMDLLFSKGAYESALEVLSVMRSQGLKCNRDALLLACGTYYKMNTEKSYKMCRTLIEDSHHNDQFIPRKAYCFAVALALRQNDINTAQIWFSYIFNTNGKLCQNLKVLLLTMSEELGEAVSILSAATLKRHSVVKPLFSQEVVDLLQLRSKDGPYMATLEVIVSQLVQTGQVIQQTLDDILCFTPPLNRKPLLEFQERREFSRRTLRPLHSILRSD